MIELHPPLHQRIQTKTKQSAVVVRKSLRICFQIFPGQARLVLKRAPNYLGSPCQCRTGPRRRATLRHPMPLAEHPFVLLLVLFFFPTFLDFDSTTPPSLCCCRLGFVWPHHCQSTLHIVIFLQQKKKPAQIDRHLPNQPPP